MQRTNSSSSSGSVQPCSGSILLNPLPGSSTASGSTSTGPRSPPAVSGSLASASNARPRRPSVAVCVSATAEPPAWYQAEQHGNQPGTPYGSPPKGSSKSRSNSVDRWGVDSDDSNDDERPVGASRGRLPNGKETSIQFAPLPPGRQRSNSITIGVASRAHMLNAQGGAVNAQHNYGRQARYAGPQWCQAGGTVPPDVYTYKDLARGVNNLWRKATKTRRASTASTTSSASAEQALDMERDAKSKGAIEHIEEADEEHDQQFNDDDEEDDDAPVESDSDLEVERGRALGMSMGAFRAGSVESSSSGEQSEGSGTLSTSATSTGTAEVGDEKWEAAEAERRRRVKGKGKAVVQGA